jgi:hypothetical protein
VLIIGPGGRGACLVTPPVLRRIRGVARPACIGIAARAGSNYIVDRAQPLR